MRKFINVLICLLFSFCPQMTHSKIYDCFIFFNELDILEIRLNELYDQVDKFVLVESSETFRGNSKPLYYDENKARFSKFADKIIHVIVTDRKFSGDAWAVETFQRNQIMRGLKECQSDDIILVSDVDEIPRASIFPQINTLLNVEKKEGIKCEQPLYRFFLNARDYIVHWTGTVGTKYSNMSNKDPNTLRNARHNYPMISNAGWHFTFMGGPDYVKTKYESFSHSEADLPENKSLAGIFRYLKAHSSIVSIDQNYPKFVQDNLRDFMSKGFIFIPLVSVETSCKDFL